MALHFFNNKKTQLAKKNTAVFVTMGLFILKCLFGNVNLELSILMLSHTVEGGPLHRLFPNVNSETAKYTSPRKLCSVYLAVSLLTLVETALGALCSQVLLSLGCASASENLTAKCTSCSFNSSPAKSNFKSASSRCARLARLKNGLSRT